MLERCSPSHYSVVMQQVYMEMNGYLNKLPTTNKKYLTQLALALCGRGGQCSLCNRLFKHQSSLTDHMRKCQDLKLKDHNHIWPKVLVDGGK